MDFDVWDIVKVPFPYTNRSVQQFRPALVIARHGGSTEPTLLWVLMVTSALHRPWPGDVRVTDLAAAGLGAESVVRSAKVATVESAAAIRIGSLLVSDAQTVAANIKATLAACLSM